MEKKESESKNETLGFKDKDKAIYTLSCLNGRDITYQYRAISNYHRSAKKILKITKDETKKRNISEAIEIFDDWLSDYKDNERGKTNLSYLPIETVEAFRPLAKSYGISDEEFYEAYKKIDGDYKAMRDVKTNDDDDESKTITWDIERNKRLKSLISKIESKKLKWYETRENAKEEYPSREHTLCILLAYSPDPAKLRALVPKIAKILKAGSDDEEMKVDETRKKKQGTKRSHRSSRSKSSSSSNDSSSSSENEEPSRKKKSPKKQQAEPVKQEEVSGSGLGFKDKEKALKSIELLKGRDLSYQYHALSGLVKRAARVISCTKDEAKITNMREAVEVLENWITDYSVNQRSKENFGYLGLELVQAYEPLAKKYGVKDCGFIGAYEKVDGDYKKLRSVKIPSDDSVTWDIERNKCLRKIVDGIKEKSKVWFEKDDETMRGLPTKEHTECIMWGFSHEPAKLKKTLKLLNEML